MALATRCPHCQTLFRVAAEQLKTRNGMVRCGSCRQVFNAITGLGYHSTDQGAQGDAARVASSAAAAQAAPPPEPQTQAGAAAAELPARPGPDATLSIASAALALSARSSAAPAVPAAALVPAPAPTLVAAASDLARAARREARRKAWEAAQHKAQPVATREPRRSAKTKSPPLEPAFLARGGRAARHRTLTLRGLGIALLVASLLIQTILLCRARLLVDVPQVRAALEALCATLGCRSSWPMRPDLLAVIGSELESIPGTEVLQFDVVVRNRASFTQALPAIELTLTDSLERTLTRRVVTPAEYLSSATLGRSAGIAPDADLSIHIDFTLPGVAVSGFEAYPFYP